MMHTKGPWKAERDLCVVDWSGRDIARLFSTIGNYEREAANARLVAAACTSYDRHCGERAVEAAEADLLGQALEALKSIADNTGPGQGTQWFRDTANAVLALAKGEK